MKRIKLEQVQKAYEKTGLKSVRSKFFSMKKEKLVGACPVGALFYAKLTKKQKEDFSNDENVPFEWAEDYYGFAYINGFYAGFDGERYSKTKLNEAGPEFATGFKDGQVCWKGLKS